MLIFSSAPCISRDFDSKHSNNTVIKLFETYNFMSDLSYTGKAGKSDVLDMFIDVHNVRQITQQVLSAMEERLR